MSKNIEILIISDSYDFSTDIICIELNKRNQNYLRINRDKFNKYKIIFDISKESLIIQIENNLYSINQECLYSIFYRAPIYLYSFSGKKISFEKQLFKNQWTAFIRNLSIFDNVQWMNNPNDTFKAENKFIQLKYAKEVGFNIPKTHVINNSELINISKEKKYIIKTIDTALLRNKKGEAFIYSNILTGKDIDNYDLSLSPFFIQEYLNPKIDLRVTVVNNEVFTVKIISPDKMINCDWRLLKKGIEYIDYQLPNEIINKCIILTKKLNLKFAGIDLIYSNKKFYFIEINPTGEWGWLFDKTNKRIDYAICDFLQKN